MQTPPPPLFEAVYYASPIPSGIVSLTSLAIVFDRLHFPNVYLPTTGYDPADAAKEARRIEGLQRTDYDTRLLVGAMRALPHLKDLNEFCTFGGQAHQVFSGENHPDTSTVVSALDEMIFGPPPQGFTPSYATGFHKGLPGSQESINYPGFLHYPAIALLYAAKSGLPLVNDNPSLPVPGRNGLSAKHNAKLLSSILALECVRVALPSVRPLSPAAIVELRNELRPYLAAFRVSLGKLAQQLNLHISSDSDDGDVRAAASFLVQTEVEPVLAELRDQLAKPAGRWIDRAFSVAKDLPLLAAAAASTNPGSVWAQAAATIGGLLINLKDNDSRKQVARSGIYFLLKAQDANSRPRTG